MSCIAPSLQFSNIVHMLFQFILFVSLFTTDLPPSDAKPRSVLAFAVNHATTRYCTFNSHQLVNVLVILFFHAFIVYTDRPASQ